MTVGFVQVKEVSFLDELIKYIVEADKEARGNVDAKKREKSDVQQLISEQLEVVKAQCRMESDRFLEAERSRMEQEVATRTKEEQQLYKEASARLEAQYAQHKDEWVSHIVESCLNA